MKGNKSFVFFLACSAVITGSAQKQESFKTDPLTSVQYRLIKHDKNGVKPVEGNYAHLIMVWKGKTVKGDADSIYLDSRKKGGDSVGAIVIKLAKSFTGCLEQGVMMMAKGDSAVFRIKGDSLFLKTFHYPQARIPAFVNGSTYFTFNVKLVSYQTEDEVKAMKVAQMQKRNQMTMAMKNQEPAVIADYLKKNNYNVQPDADGIYYLQTTPGTGKQVAVGDSCEVKYKGMFLDGKIFDPGTRPYTVVYSQNAAVIKGWISILGKMREGEKVTVLIPSSMGYADHGMGPIQPYTPLLFEMELLRVVKGNQ